MNNQYYYPYSGDIPQQKTLHVSDILAIVLLSLLASSIGLLYQYNSNRQEEQQTSMVSYAQQFMKENGISSMKNVSYVRSDGTAFNGILVRDGNNVAIQ